MDGLVDKSESLAGETGPRFPPDPFPGYCLFTPLSYSKNLIA